MDGVSIQGRYLHVILGGGGGEADLLDGLLPLHLLQPLLVLLHKRSSTLFTFLGLQVQLIIDTQESRMTACFRCISCISCSLLVLLHSRN